MYMFTYLFIVDKKLDFWPAMQASHELVKKDYFGFTLFFVALILINRLWGFGVFPGAASHSCRLLLPLITAAYRDLVGFENQENSLSQ